MLAISRHCSDSFSGIQCVKRLDKIMLFTLVLLHLIVAG